jgi:hypothetical protein
MRFNLIASISARPVGRFSAFQLDSCAYSWRLVTGLEWPEVFIDGMSLPRA